MLSVKLVWRSVRSSEPVKLEKSDILTGKKPVGLITQLRVISDDTSEIVNPRGSPSAAVTGIVDSVGIALHLFIKSDFLDLVTSLV
jgi:hypothetical protein